MLVIFGKYLELTEIGVPIVKPRWIYWSFFCSDEWRSRWVDSKHKSDYGEWKLTAGKFYGDAEKDKGKLVNVEITYWSVTCHSNVFLL